MRDVQFIGNMQVKVGAGCNLGFDPFDPTGSSTEKEVDGVVLTNGLFDQLQAKGLAIPNVTDAIHQTVGGFISTASSGGTVSHSLLDHIISIRLINGTGKVQVFNRPEPDDPDDPFYAVGVSLGLLGVIVEVSFQCIPSFNVIGQQTITSDKDAAFNFLGEDSSPKPSLQSFLTNTEFTRLIWWPFFSVKRLIAWQARTMQPSDYNQQTGPPDNFHPKPYEDAFSSSDLPIVRDLPPEIQGYVSELIASGIFSLIGSWPKPLYDLFGNFVVIDNKSIRTSFIQSTIDLLWPIILPHLLNGFIPVDGTKPPQAFWDVWQRGLANDTHEYSNNLLPAYRTEFWIPVEQAEQAMKMLDDFFTHQLLPKGDSKNRNYANACYVVEILGAKSSNFWLSPSYQQDCMRVNLYSLQQNDENVFDYFRQFWDLFFNSKKINFRLHWGYYLPKPDSDEGTQYLLSQYPKWSAFETLRKTMDPHNIFLSTYWKQQLGISTEAHVAAEVM